MTQQRSVYLQYYEDVLCQVFARGEDRVWTLTCMKGEDLEEAETIFHATVTRIFEDGEEDYKLRHVVQKPRFFQRWFHAQTRYFRTFLRSQVDSRTLLTLSVDPDARNALRNRLRK